jgi:hypothetical protein
MPAESIRANIERRARRAIIENALFRPESAIVIAGVILLTFFIPQPFAFWPVWGWLALGAVAEILIVVTSLTDAATNERVVSALFREEFNPRAIRNKAVREKVERALEYQRRIEATVQGAREGPLRTHMHETARGIGDWIATIFRLAQRLDAYLADDLIRQDMNEVKPSIANLAARLRVEDDPAVRAQLQATIESKQQQLASLNTLDNTMQRADYLLEQSLSAMGTVYSQLQLIGAKDVDSPRAQALRRNIAEQVSQLQDVVNAMDEVYRREG